MKITISEIRKVSKDYNSNSLGYTVELEINPNELQQKTQGIENWINAQFTRRSTEKEAQSVFTGAKVSGSPTTKQPDVPRANGTQTSTTKQTGASPAQYGLILKHAYDSGRADEIFQKLKADGIYRNKEKTYTNMTIAQFNEYKLLLGVQDKKQYGK